MAYLAIDKDGDEHIFQSLPKRVGSKLLELPKEYFGNWHKHKDMKDLILFTWKDEKINDDDFKILDIEDKIPIMNLRLNKYKDFFRWEDPVYESWDGQGGKPELHHYTDIPLPYGSIEKLTGKKITWYDEPIKIE